MTNNKSRTQICQYCGEEIDDLPLYPSRDIEPTDGGFKPVDDPDGPFCSGDCRRDFDDE